LDNINSYQYKYISDKNNEVHYGLIAQEIKELLPELVTEDDEGLLRIKYNEFIPIIIQYLKELKKNNNLK
jgi:hypothetical protein